MISSQLVPLWFEAIDAHRSPAENGLTLLGVKRSGGSAVGVHQITIARPKLFDRKVRPEQAAFGAEQRERVVQNFIDVRRIVAMDEGADPGQLRDDVRTFRTLAHAGP